MFLAEMVFAAICYYYPFLNEKIAPECTLCALLVFLDIPPEVYSLAVVKVTWNKTTDTPKFTGISPHVMMLSEMER